MDEQLIALYQRHVATAFDRKLRLAAFVALKAGKVKAKYEVATAAIAFGPALAFEAPLLGSHAHGNHSHPRSNSHLFLRAVQKILSMGSI